MLIVGFTALFVPVPDRQPMTKATLSIETFLLDDYLVIRQKLHRDLAPGGLARNERRHVTRNVRFANGFAKIRIASARHPFAVELNPQLIVAQREYAKVVATGFVHAVDLGGGDGATR